MPVHTQVMAAASASKLLHLLLSDMGVKDLAPHTVVARLRRLYGSKGGGGSEAGSSAENGAGTADYHAVSVKQHQCHLAYITSAKAKGCLSGSNSDLWGFPIMAQQQQQRQGEQDEVVVDASPPKYLPAPQVWLGHGSDGEEELRDDLLAAGAAFVHPQVRKGLTALHES